MKNKDIGFSILYSALYVLEILFLYAISVNATSFYAGYTGAWITLFTFMVISGAILMYLVLNVLFKNKKRNDVIIRNSEYINILILSVLGLYADAKVAAVLFMINGIQCFIRREMIQKILRVMIWFILVYYCLFAYQAGWITMTNCILFILAQGTLYTNECNALETTEEKSKGNGFIGCLVCLSAYALLLTFKKIEEGLIHIANEGEIFKLYRLLPWMLCICLVMIFINLYKIKQNEKNKINLRDGFIISQISFGVFMLLCTYELWRANYLLSLIILMCMFSFYAIEVLCIFFLHVQQETFNSVQWVMMHLILCVVFISSQALYDGITVDVSVVLMSAFMMYGANVWIKYSSHDISFMKEENE